MSVTKTLTRSFAGGEIAPELMGRLDLDKFQTALKQCRNWIPLAHGPVRNRPGTEFVAYVRDSSAAARLVPFQWSNTQTMVLEYGPSTVRFHTTGDTLLGSTQSVTSITCGSTTTVTKAAHGYAANDSVYFAGITGTAATMLNGRFMRVADVTANTFILVQGNGDLVDTTGLTAVVTAATMATAYTVATPYAADDLFNIRYVQNSDVLTLTHTGYAPRELRRLGAANWELSTITFEPSIASPASDDIANNAEPYIIPTYPGGATYAAFNSYVVTAVTDDDEESEPSDPAITLRTWTTNTISTITDATQAVITVASDPGAYAIVGGTIRCVGLPNSTADQIIAYNLLEGKDVDIVAKVGAAITVNVDTSAMSGNLTPGAGRLWLSSETNGLSVAGAKNTIVWDAVTGASYYKIYKSTIAGGVKGYIGRTTSTSFVDNNITPDTTKTAAEIQGAFNTAGDYPKCSSYFEQRRCFSSTTNDPQTVWMTQTGTETNLLSSVPHQDSDSIRFRMAARDHNAIEHMVPMNDLILLTSAGEWRAFAPNGDPITATSLVIRPQSYTGCNAVTPVLTAGSMIYVQYGGWSLQELAYSWESQTYKSTNITAMAPHLFEDQGVVDMAFQRMPVPILWCVMDSGDLVSCTYMPEHKVIAYATHDTQGGNFKSVCTVVEDGEDRVYFVVERTDSNGATVKMIERLASMQQVSDIADSFYVDCGLTYSGAATTTISGLWHLEGKTLSCLTDGAVHPQVTVLNGSVTLDYEASKVVLGLPITAQAETMPLAFEVEDGGVSNVKNINRLHMKLKRTSGLKVGPDADKLVDTTTRTDEMYGVPAELFTGIKDVFLFSDWTSEGTIIMRQDDPLPAMVMSIAFEVAIDA